MTRPADDRPAARTASGTGRPRRSLAILAAILTGFVILRGPILWRQPGGLDEEYYAIPGLTVLREGIPRMPHVPQRDPARPFYLADQALFAEPPFSFYWQALFYAVLPDTYGAARTASAIAALATIVLVYELGRTLYRNERAALWAAGLYSLARTFYFPAITARPDMLCTAFGLGALLCLAHWHEARKTGLLVLAGVLLGLGGLTHPFALAYALQAAVWAFVASQGSRRVLHPGILAASAMGVFALWLPLIAQYPEAFRSQFLNNILDPTGPGLLARLVWPWASLRHHAWMISGHLGAIQFSLLLGGAFVAAVSDLWRREDGPVIACLLAWSSIYLLAAAAGLHPTQYFWCYPTALLCVCTGRATTIGLDALTWRPAWIKAAAAVLLIALMLPGAGLRTWLAHIRHWNHIDYNAPAFARRMLADLPADARYTVDREFALDFLAAGRRVLLAETYPVYFSAENFSYDYLIISRHGLDEDLPDQMDGELIRTYGDREDLFACYAEIYRPAQRTRRGD